MENAMRNILGGVLAGLGVITGFWAVDNAANWLEAVACFTTAIAMVSVGIYIVPKEY